MHNSTESVRENTISVRLQPHTGKSQHERQLPVEGIELQLPSQFAGLLPYLVAARIMGWLTITGLGFWLTFRFISVGSDEPSSLTPLLLIWILVGTLDLFDQFLRTATRTAFISSTAFEIRSGFVLGSDIRVALTDITDHSLNEGVLVLHERFGAEIRQHRIADRDADEQIQLLTIVLEFALKQTTLSPDELESTRHSIAELVF